MNTRFVRIACLGVATVAVAVFAQEQLTIFPSPMPSPPLTGTFRSMTLMQPPFPFNPFPQLPVYSLGDGSFVYDDRTVDYVALRAEIAAEASQASSLQFSSSSVLLGGGGVQTMSLSGPPPPGGGGGGGGSGGGGITSPPPYSVSGLKLTIPVLTNGYIYTTIFEHNPALAYDIYTKTNLNSTNWLFGIWGVVSQTNYYLLRSNYPADVFLMTASGLDSDGDGMPDNWEAMNGLNPHVSDANGDPDGDGISNFDEWRYGLNPLLDDAAQSGKFQEMRYDSRGRLKNFFAPIQFIFSYDLEGNVTQIQ